jgi:hypothetical protein
MTTSLLPPAPPPPAPGPPAPVPGVPAGRTLTRRPALPGGRAVVGALLIVAAAVGTFVVATGGDGGPTTEYPVLAQTVDPGQPIDDDDLEWRAMDLDPVVASRTFREPGDLRGAIALSPLAEGELLQRGQVATAGEGATGTGGQISIPVPVDRTPPNLRRGEQVAVLATYGSGAGATTILTVADATVLGHERDGDAIGASATSRLTLALVDPTQVVATAHAAQVAELTVVRTSPTWTDLPQTYRREIDPRLGAPSSSDAGAGTHTAAGTAPEPSDG